MHTVGPQLGEHWGHSGSAHRGRRSGTGKPSFHLEQGGQMSVGSVDTEGRLTRPGDGGAQRLEGGAVKVPGVGVHSWSSEEAG